MGVAEVFVHDRGLCESEEVGAGTRIWAFAHIMRGARVGERCNICDHAFVEGGAVVGDHVTVKNGVMLWDKVTIEDYVFIGPGAVFTNVVKPRAAIKRRPDEFAATLVRRGASIGANATIVCGTTVGAFAFIGAGAVVTRDVAPYAIVVGSPARRVGWMCECGERLPRDLRCACGRTYRERDGTDGIEPKSEGP
jgi:UDP-2-acetamido-3-amino-2,3-dideoxy-glucuronate N-acetyltransferase